MKWLSILLFLALWGTTVLGSNPPKKDHLFSTPEVITLLKQTEFKREIRQWHIHHTWDPSYADFNGGNHLELQTEMRSLHVDQNGWDDIGQHLTLFPDGTWMFGRSLQKDPASILGWNKGALAVEMVGNFDIGHDQMTTLQRQAILELSHWTTTELELKPIFHRDNPTTNKTCPGNGICREHFMNAIKTYSK